MHLFGVVEQSNSIVWGSIGFKGRGHLAHRRAVEFLGRDGPLRMALDVYRHADEPNLKDHPQLWVMLQEVCLQPLCSRAVEEPHARVKRFLSTASAALPPAVCSDLRSREHVTRLDADPRFMEWMCLNYHSHLLWSRLMQLSGQLVPGMKFKDRLSKIYLHCNRSGPDMQPKGELLNQLKALTDKQKKYHEEVLPWDAKMQIDFFKHRMQPGDILSVHSAIGALALHPIGFVLEPLLEEDRRISFNISNWLGMCVDHPQEEQARLIADMSREVQAGHHVFLKVINPRPESRTENTPGHIERPRDCRSKV